MQVLKVIPYSATQLYAYESFKALFSGKEGSIGVAGRLAAGASAGMTATLVGHPEYSLMSVRQALERQHAKHKTYLKCSSIQISLWLSGNRILLASDSSAACKQLIQYLISCISNAHTSSKKTKEKVHQYCMIQWSFSIYGVL